MSMRLSIALTILALALPSCLIGANKHTDSSGQFVSAETLKRVQPGQSEEFVKDLLGEPSSKIAVDGGEEGAAIWKWSYKTETTTNKSVFLLVGAASTTSESGSTFVEFAGGKVVKVWRD